MSDAESKLGPPTVRGTLMIVLLAAAATPWASGPLALGAGMVVGLAGLTVADLTARRAARVLVQGCVVMLGFRLNLTELAHAATGGIALGACTIFATLALGWLLGTILRVPGVLSALVSVGTAICGASAIAAVGSALRAAGAHLAVATGAIFILNAIGLYALPAIGHAAGMSDAQFGAWAGIALHDVASVAAAGSSYSQTSHIAADTANVVKMTRVIWILPLAIGASWWASRRTPAPGGSRLPPIPWFILLFVLASTVRTFVPEVANIQKPISTAAKSGFQVALFLIGSGLTLPTLRAVGWRVLTQAATLWVLVAAGSFFAVRWIEQ